MCASGPTGPAGPDLEKCTLLYGDSYAFRVRGLRPYEDEPAIEEPVQFIAVVKRIDGTSGYLELDVIADAVHYSRLNAVT